MSPLSAALAAVLLPFAAHPGHDACCEEDGVAVSVVAVLATDQNDKIDPRIKCIADEARNHDPTLTGFRIAARSTQTVPVGGRYDFDLGCDQTLRVVVQQKNDKEDCYRLIITPPQMGKIKYTTTCGKYIPVMTPFKTKDGELLIVAICVRNCADKDK
jgi:hypothetical protein